MTLYDLIKNGTDRLLKSKNPDAANDAKLFAMYLLNISYSDIIVRMKDEIDEDVCNRFDEFIDRRCAHEPTQYIIGSTCFMGYDFYVMSEVLIPRPETELLVEEAYELTKNMDSVKALDMCTGSGCIGISYRLFRRDRGNKESVVTLADISDSAITLCGRNNDRYEGACEIIKTDLFANISDKYDIILSNPPYIRTADIAELTEEVREHEPLLALDGLEDGLFFYREIIKSAREHLKEDGIIVFEIGYDQFEDVKNLLEKADFVDIKLKRDYAGLERVVSARIS